MGIRKSTRNLSEAEWNAFRAALNALRTEGGGATWQAFVDRHRLHGHDIHTHDDNVNERFLPWHRSFVRAFERELQRFDANVSVPYWDWLHERRIPPGIAGTLGLASNRDPQEPGELPSDASVNDALAQMNFRNFTRRFEEVHGTVHVWVGGEMLDIQQSPSDPLFFMHHANVDRLWHLWQGSRSNQDPRLPMDQPIVDSPETLAQLVNISDMGYSYADQGSGVVGDRLDTRDWSEGWTQAPAYRTADGIFLFLLKKDGGTVHIHRLRPNGTIAAMVAEYDWSDGWTSVELITIQNTTYLYLLKRESGVVHTHAMHANGTVGPRLETFNWSGGWTQARPFMVGGHAFLFLLKKEGGQVHIHRLGNDGRVGPRVFEANWSSGWTSIAFYTIGGEAYLVLLKESDGCIHVHRMAADGGVGPRVDTRDWTSGYTNMQVLRSGGQQYLMLLKKDDGHVVTHHLLPDGRIGARVANSVYNWSGWTVVSSYEVDAEGRLLLLKTEDDGSMHLHRVRAV